MNTSARTSAVLGLLLALGPGAHADVSTGVRVIPTYGSSRFDNGAQVDVTALPVTFFVHNERFSLRATLPYLQMRTDLPVVNLGGPFFSIPVGGQTIDENGLGDLVLTPSVLLNTIRPHRPSVWAGARIKLPTADEEKYLGTGKADYGPAAGLLVPVGERLLLSGSAHYDVRGDPPNNDLKNTLSATLAGRVGLGTLSGLSLAFTRTDAARQGHERTWDGSALFDYPLRATGFTLQAGLLGEISGDATGYGVAIGFTYRDDPLPWGQ